MLFSNPLYASQYTSEDWRIMREAHMLASHILARHHQKHEHSERLARTVMNFFDRGIRDIETLSTLAANRETILARQQILDKDRRKRHASVLSADSLPEIAEPADPPIGPRD
ncbi:MAG: hypothetical protein ACREIP_08085 [Alphaproteobacteria bacterium]